MGEIVVLKDTTESIERSIEELAKILGILGNKDAIKILRFAKSGFDSSTDMHKELGLSVKRYYYRLKKLMDADLITKRNNRYELTPLGEIVCDSIEREIVWAIENIDRLRIIGTLRTSDIDNKTLEKITTAVLGSELGNLLGGVEVIKTYEELAEVTYRLIENSRQKIIIASRYTDAKCVEAWWRALNRGVETWAINGDVGLYDGRIKMLRMVITHPESIKAFYALWHSKRSHVRHREVPFSFMVVNGNTACFEILNPTMKEFFAALKLESKEICDKLLMTFDKLWEGAGEDPLKRLSEDLMRRL